jgi:hypothetical protein
MTKGKPKQQTPALVPGLAKPAQRALAGAGIERLEDFSRVTEDEVAKLHGIGPRALDQVKRSLRQAGSGFARAKAT